MPCFASFLSSGFEMFFGKAPKRIAVSKFDQAVQGMADIFFLLPSCRFYTETPKTVSRCMFSGRFWAFSFDISGFILAPVSFSVRHSKAAVCRFQVTKKRRIATTLLSCSEEAAPLLFINICTELFHQLRSGICGFNDQTSSFKFLFGLLHKVESVNNKVKLCDLVISCK